MKQEESKTFNLISEKWIPVQLKSGMIAWVRPSGVVSDDIVRIATGRPDFDAACLMFVIALLQTVCTPDTEQDWRTWFDHAPSEQSLFDELIKYRSVFNLNGDGPRYMQDFDLNIQDANFSEIGSMLMDGPGENGIKNNTDYFVRRDRIEQLSLPALAMALTYLQMHASAAGQGYRVSLRGGGPLTTLVSIPGDTLWKNVWANVLPETMVPELTGDPSLATDQHIFPWMTRTRTSKNGEVIVPDQIHPWTMLWAMPWRIRVDFGDDIGDCDVLPRCAAVIKKFYKAGSGNNYKGSFFHPWTPYHYLKTKDNEGFFPAAMREEGVPYKEWPDLVLTSHKSRCAIVIRYFSEHRISFVPKANVIAFGYEMDRAKARAWFSRSGMILSPTPEVAPWLSEHCAQMVDASEQYLSLLMKAVTYARKRYPDSICKNINGLKAAFWKLGETFFFETVLDLWHRLEKEGTSDLCIELKERWLVFLQKVTISLFEKTCGYRSNIQQLDIARYGRAHTQLVALSSPNGPKVRKMLGLPVAEKPVVKPAKAPKTPKEKPAKAPKTPKEKPAKAPKTPKERQT